MKYNLVTSTQTYLWSKNNINFLVGDWCLTNEIKKKNYQFKFQKYHGENRKKLVRKINFLFKIYLYLLKKITKSLNKYHKVSFSEKYWETLLSRWLWHFLMYTFDRWEILRSLKNKENIFFTKKVIYDDKSFINNNTLSFIRSAHDPIWNSWIFSKMINFFPKIKVLKNRKKTKTIRKKNERKKKFDGKKFIFENNDKIFIKDLYFDKFLKIKIKIGLKNFNFLNYSTPNYYIPGFKIENKRLNFKFLNRKENNNYLNFLNQIIKYQIPKVFLEGFKPTNSLLDKLNWPKNPKVVLTSISHLNDDFFKFYIANRRQKGSKLFVFQHGCGYIYDDLNLGHIFESRISDKFFTWGCRSKQKNIHPLFVTTTAGKVIKKSKKRKGFIIPLYDFARFPNRLTSFLRTGSDVKNYISNFENFLSNLRKEKIKQLKIKFRLDEKNSIVSEELKKNILKRYKQIKVYDNKKHYIYEESIDYNLIIETCNSTNFLECISLNIPIVLLWNKNIIISKKYKKFYKELEKTRIIHKSPKSLAEFINKNENFEKWWYSDKLQKSLNTFREKICKNEKYPINHLKQIINNAR